MIFHISSRTGVPPYLQIVQQVKQDIRLGLIKEGDKLPAVREVVTMVAINPNTVVKAYRELENQGLIEKRAGIGTFVTKQPAGPSPDVQSALLDKLEGWMEEAKNAGLDEEAAEALFHTAQRNKRGDQRGTDNKK
jgi:GntR family transcriptional regulator